MPDLPPLFLALPIACLLALGLIPSQWCNRHRPLVRRLVTQIVGLQAGLAGIALAMLLLSGEAAVYTGLWQLWSEWPVGLSIYYDGVSGLMLTLVSFIGWVICRFSIRYLDGEFTQGRYFRWAAFTIGAVSLMVISGNLLMFVVAWVLTSLGLHQLLLHYSHRPAAQRAAWSKFTISRLGDVALLVALVLTFLQFSTFEFEAIFALLEADRLAGLAPTAQRIWIGSLIVFGALTKSAQFPFHTWLPQTMETPTPVSALMHAGIVNAGGYLIIRTSPIVAEATYALAALAIIGAFTACFAAIVMLTQTSIKQSLAYSTIAQMGFMMLQCGLGAYSAAMVHILAHSLYKAHAFLSSGSVLTHRASVAGTHPIPQGDHSAAGLASILRLLAAATSTVTIFLAVMFALGLSLTNKPGGILLGGLLCLALSHWLWSVWSTGNRRVLLTGIGTVALLSLAYGTSFQIIDAIVTRTVVPTAGGVPLGIVLAIVLVGFGSLLLLHIGLAGSLRPRWLSTLYVHAANGFYVEPALRRLIGTLASN